MTAPATAACGRTDSHGAHATPERRPAWCAGNIGPVLTEQPVPHDPTSAELAAFRRSIRPVRMAAGGIAYPPIAPPTGGAWQHERENGIGKTLVRTPMAAWLKGDRSQSRDLACEARREAARIRSDDYAAMTIAAMSDPDAADALRFGHETFAPDIHELHAGHGGAAGNFRPEGCLLCPVETAAPVRCSGCHAPDVEHGHDWPAGSPCPHCGSLNRDTRTHYHPYRSTTD
jgi:hypothetical protein